MDKVFNSLKILFLLFLLSSCRTNKNNCLVNYTIYKGIKESPALSVTKKTEDKCHYQIKLLNCFQGFNESNGEMYVNNNGVYIKLLQPKTTYFRLFDFFQQVEDIKNINIISSGNNKEDFRIRSKLESVIVKDNMKVYIFRLIDFICFEKKAFDTVFFVTKDNGVIGSYHSTYNENGVEVVIYPVGDVLENIIDYSKKERGVIM
jgi:hypothetical protein